MPLHKDLTGAELHEPKGVESALSGTVYVANGVGSGSWTNLGGDRVTLTTLTSEDGKITIPTGANLQQALQLMLDSIPAKGPQGPAGVGVPAGGTSGQVLTKNTNTDYDTSWQSVNLPVDVNIDTRSLVTTTSIPTAVTYIRTAGYYTPGDGGGALYKRVSSEPSHAGKVQSADGAWWELNERVISVRTFGAKGDAASDDAPCFQQAYDYLKSKGGGTVLIPATAHGLNYAFFSQVFIDTLVDVTFQGIGNPYLMSYMNDGKVMFVIGTGTTITQRNIVFNDMRIFGNASSTTGTAIYVFYCTRFRMNRVVIHNHKGFGLWADHCYALYLNDCIFTSNGEGNVYLSGASGNGSLFTHCTFNDSPIGKYSVYVDGTSAGPHYGTTFQSCLFEFNDIGLVARHVHAINLKGCYFEFNTGNHFRLVDCKGVSIDGNSIFGGVGFFGTSDGVKVVSNCGEFGASIYGSSSTNVSIEANSGPTNWITQGS